LSDEDVALAEAVFGMLSLFKNVSIDAAQSCSVGSPERGRMLWSLKAGPVRAGWLAQITKLSPSAVTEALELLERDHLVRREHDPDDRRAVRVALTSEGRKQLQQFEHACAAALAARLASLSATQRQRIRGAFNDLRELIVSKNFIESSRPDTTLRSTTRKEAVHAR
jgi:DNA-binding MarR family transcriptional regulator